MRLVAIALMFLAAQGAVARDIVPDTPFRQFRATDALQRDIVYYLARSPTESAPLLVFLQGSGCAPHFRRRPDGTVSTGYASLLARVAAGRAHVLAVEKPGVEPFDPAERGGDARGCSWAFLAEHTLDRWAIAVDAAIGAATAGGRPASRIVAIGHSEGAATAARLARRSAGVTHVALLSPSGLGQLADFKAQAARHHSTSGAEAVARAIGAIDEQAARIRASPDSIDDFAWGHPYRRWPEFLEPTIMADVGQAGPGVRVFLAFGTADRNVPPESGEALADRLPGIVSALEIDRRIDGDHSLNLPGQRTPAGMIEVFGKILDWAAR